jgi:signal transduction histidine kinase/DNA-binding NarL/FixJ family response regulator
MIQPLFLPRYLAFESSFLLFANILLGMLLMVALHCLVTALRSREKNYLYLGLFFIGALINTVGNLYIRFFIPTIEPYIGSWLMMFSFILFIENYLSLPYKRIRLIVERFALGICGLLFFLSILHNILYGRGDTAVIFAMDVVTALILLSLMGFLLFHFIKGNNRGLALFLFELTIVIGGISALGIVKALVRDLNLFPLEVLQGNLIFITGMVVNGFLFSHLLSRDLEQLKVETARAEAKSWELKELNKAKSEFLMNITHEFRTPLTVIGGVVKQLRKGRWGDSIQANRRHLDIIERNNGRLLKQVNNLLQLASLERKRFSLNPAAMDLSKVLHSLAGEFQSISLQHSLSIDVRVPEKLGLTADSSLLQSALINLLSNAVKFSNPGGSIEIGAHSNGEEIGVYVSDTGIGIPDEQQALIFDRFHQAHSGNTKVSEGTGIGLSLVREIMEQHQGRVELESTEGQGARFTLYFPTHAAPSLSPSPSSLPRSEPALLYGNDQKDTQHEKQIHLLIVEDSADLTEYLRAELEPAYRLTLSKNGREALEKIRKKRPDIILSDVMMPEMDGYELLETLQGDEKTMHIPFVFLTARDSIEEQVDALEKGSIEYMVKPFSAEVLRAKIDSIMKHTEEAQTHYRDSLKAEISRLITAFPDSSRDTDGTHEVSGMDFEEISKQFNLTAREREIAGLIRRGCSDKEIAGRLGLSAKTVSNYNTSLFKKFKVSGRNELTAYAFRLAK